MLYLGQIKEKCILRVYLCYTVIILYSALLGNKTNQFTQKPVSRVPHTCGLGWGGVNTEFGVI